MCDTRRLEYVSSEWRACHSKLLGLSHFRVFWASKVFPIDRWTYNDGIYHGCPRLLLHSFYRTRATNSYTTQILKYCYRTVQTWIPQAPYKRYTNATVFLLSLVPFTNEIAIYRRMAFFYSRGPRPSFSRGYIKHRGLEVAVVLGCILYSSTYFVFRFVVNRCASFWLLCKIGIFIAPWFFVRVYVIVLLCTRYVSYTGIWKWWTIIHFRCFAFMSSWTVLIQDASAYVAAVSCFLLIRSNCETIQVCTSSCRDHNLTVVLRACSSLKVFPETTQKSIMLLVTVERLPRCCRGDRLPWKSNRVNAGVADCCSQPW